MSESEQKAKVVQFPVKEVIEQSLGLLDEEEAEVVMSGMLECMDEVSESQASRVIQWMSSAKALASMYDLVMSGEAVVGLTESDTIVLYPSESVQSALTQ